MLSKFLRSTVVSVSGGHLQEPYGKIISVSQHVLRSTDNMPEQGQSSSIGNDEPFSVYPLCLLVICLYMCNITSN